MKQFNVGVKAVVATNRGVLLLRTNQDRGDRWEFPGGRIDGDEDFADTIRRELSEEVPGTELIAVDELLGAYRLPRDIAQDLSLVLLFYKVTATVPSDVVLSDEHVGHMWVTSKKDIPENLAPHLVPVLEQVLP